MRRVGLGYGRSSPFWLGSPGQLARYGVTVFCTLSCSSVAACPPFLTQALLPVAHALTFTCSPAAPLAPPKLPKPSPPKATPVLRLRLKPVDVAGFWVGVQPTSQLAMAGAEAKARGGRATARAGRGEERKFMAVLLEVCQVEVWKLPRWRPPESPAEARALKVGAFLN